MKTKIMMLACLLAAPATQLMAQEATTASQKNAIVETQGDSIIIKKGEGDLRIRVYETQTDRDTPKEVEIFEGVYLEKVDGDKRSFLDALPFIPQSKRHNAYEPHNSGVFLGFSGLANHFLGFGNSKQANIEPAHSWEFGFNFLSNYCNFKKNPHWGVNFGVNWGYRSFSINGNRALLKGDNAALLAEGDEETTYSKSRLRHFFFRVPITLEWQQKSSNYQLFFFNFGPEFEIRHNVRSFAHINGGKKQTMGKGMYVRPVDVNLLVQAGYGDVGVYLRYSTCRLFQKDKGIDVMPYSFGIAWYW